MEEEIIKEESTSASEIKQEEIVKKKEHKKIAIKINVRTIIVIAIIIILGVLAYFYKGLFIAATVDGSSISRFTIISKLEKASGQSLLDALITEKLIQSEAKAKGIVISDKDIDAEIKKIEDQVVAQGGTLDEALSTQGLSIDDLKKQIVLQKEVEKLVGDKINVTDQEVAQYITDNKISVPQGQETVINDQIKKELSTQKLDTEAQTLISNLKAKAKIKYFVKY